MQADHETISKSLLLYAKYLKVMDINDRPIITFTKQEYRQAIGTERLEYLRVNKISDKSLDNVFGQCLQKFKQWNSVIFLNMEQFKEFYGLHEIKKLDKIYKKKYVWMMYKGKRVRGYKYALYQRYTKIPHLEETLVHELLHHKETKLRHGKTFNKKVEHYIRIANK